METTTLHPVVMKLNFPFITRKPSFCGRTLIEGHNTELLHRYVLAMALELKANAADLADCEVQAIRLGGGSASIINGSDLDHLLRLIRSCYHVAEDAPVTMRTCPADINGANMPFYNRSHLTRYDLELYSLEPLDFCTLDTQLFRTDALHHPRFPAGRPPRQHGLCAAVRQKDGVPLGLPPLGAGGDAPAGVSCAAAALRRSGYAGRRGIPGPAGRGSPAAYRGGLWAKPGCEEKFWQGAANGMDVLAFGLSAYTRLDGMITTNTSDLNTYLAHSADYEQITVSTVPVQTAE